MLPMKSSSSTWVGRLRSCKNNSRYVLDCYVYLLRKTWDSLIAALLSLLFYLTAFHLFLHSLISLVGNCLNLPFGTQGRSRRLKSSSYK